MTAQAVITRTVFLVEDTLAVFRSGVAIHRISYTLVDFGQQDHVTIAGPVCKENVTGTSLDTVSIRKLLVYKIKVNYFAK